mmetsp:Transcript_125481/g.349249  ORF Transcript_125481/g.349249 Transcript_125481/m.349249 type:complete len:228 (+) Transcript_125481:119-802(+)|eukprot:CAMPEP_0179053308 /NCGR_PEP_ID=MMETSP0796-20121207/22204_1 /TAXON_ID=73915 /ORGANISM="Pyrodinium bahamense, Strain pbaha01" /LENGTH=227 /DNA_ID=CAMNT_0020749897 /DNA_START=93 /DNA_END=776 /DNA_ORIENTATION=+
MALCLPGDRVDLQGVMAGVGIAIDSDSSRAFATAAGVLTQAGDGVKVENLRKRYMPRVGDVVVGIVTYRSAEAYKVDIRAPCLAHLPTLAFNGATRRNRPALEVGTLVYARVEAAHPDLDTELSCMDLQTKKSWSTGEIIFGELKGGLSFEVELSAAQRLLEHDCYVLDRLGQDFAYELCIGQNGRLWLSALTARETILILQAIRRSFGMNEVQVEAMVSKMVEAFS